MTGRLAGEPETEFQVRIPQEWQWLAGFSEVFFGISLGQEATRSGGFFWMGRAEIPRA